MTARPPDLLLAIDQGTTTTRAIVFDRGLRPVASATRPLETMHPQSGWVEQDPEAILASVVEAVAEVLAAVGGPGRIAAAGLDNQGETVVAWDATTRRGLGPAIVWQCRRSRPIVERLRAAGHEPEIRSRTGLPLDPYFSAGKLTWLLEEEPAVRTAAERGTLRFGTVDAWLTERLGDRGAQTDPSTASRTQLLDIHARAWDERLAALFAVPVETLPAIVPTSGDLGRLSHPSWGGSIPITALACDQQAALAGHGAFTPGALKATYGTGVFVLANAGPEPALVDGIETSVAWTLPTGATDYVLQGGVFTAGALVDWLRDGLGLVADVAEMERLARSVPDTAGVRVLPALAGLGAPWYRADVRAVVAGLSAAADRAHVVRATLDAIAHRVADVVEAVLPGLASPPTALRVDGGLTANGYLLERQADLLGLPVVAASIGESTALGIAGLAGIGAALLTVDDIAAANPPARRVEPRLAAAEREAERAAWRRFVEQAAAL